MDLVYQLTKREIAARYKGSMLGILWSFINPLLMLIVYTVFFSMILKIKWGGTGESQTDFAMLLFVGLIIYGFIAECINRAPGLITGNVNYVKKVVFPVAVLPVVSCGSALFHWLIGMLVLMLALYVTGHHIQQTSVLIFPVMVPLVIYALGIGWILASIGVFLRDLNQVVGVITQVLMFMSPVFFSAEKIPSAYRGLFQANPLTVIIEQARAVLIFGKPLDWGVIIIQTVFATLVGMAGYFWFRVTRSGFADVL
ncbi:ABC transporter permease [Dyella ginsengisoli]|uniref:ABC transporter permease n=1 Tax=Dyella ginsengisoli TaxID=363848 RepID=UPI001F52A55B|nr:ABC transporter permease [Dyella ginsengisoli]